MYDLLKNLKQLLPHAPWSNEIFLYILYQGTCSVQTSWLKEYFCSNCNMNKPSEQMPPTNINVISKIQCFVGWAIKSEISKREGGHMKSTNDNCEMIGYNKTDEVI